MGGTGRFGQTIFDRTIEGGSNRIFKQALIADRDKDRFDTGTGPDDRPDDFVFICQ